jgi:hypothetical protein
MRGPDTEAQQLNFVNVGEASRATEGMLPLLIS